MSVEIDKKEFSRAVVELYNYRSDSVFGIKVTEAWCLYKTVQLVMEYSNCSEKVIEAMDLLYEHRQELFSNPSEMRVIDYCGGELKDSTKNYSYTALLKNQTVDISLDKREAFNLIEVVQEAYSIPGFSQTFVCQPAKKIARELQNWIAPDGIIAEYFNKSWEILLSNRH